MGIPVGREQKHLKAAFAVVVAFATVGVFLVSVVPLLTRLFLDVRGRVVTVDRRCEAHQNNRCTTRYTIQHIESDEIFDYIRVNNSAHLRDDIPVGATIDKRRGSLDYAIDGRTVRDFSGGVLIVPGLVLLVWGIASWKLLCWRLGKRRPAS